MYLQRNESISASQFPASFNFTNVTTAFKQGSRNAKDNYRPISILPVVSKDFEKLICASNFRIILIIYFQDFRVVSEKNWGTALPSFVDRQIEK